MDTVPFQLFQESHNSTPTCSIDWASQIPMLAKMLKKLKDTGIIERNDKGTGFVVLAVTGHKNFEFLDSVPWTLIEKRFGLNG